MSPRDPHPDAENTAQAAIPRPQAADTSSERLKRSTTAQERRRSSNPLKSRFLLLEVRADWHALGSALGVPTFTRATG
eukprot:5242349-Amphidinium_carterae.1